MSSAEPELVERLRFKNTSIDYMRQLRAKEMQSRVILNKGLVLAATTEVGKKVGKRQRKQYCYSGSLGLDTERLSRSKAVLGGERGNELGCVQITREISGQGGRRQEAE